MLVLEEIIAITVAVTVIAFAGYFVYLKLRGI